MIAPSITTKKRIGSKRPFFFCMQIFGLLSLFLLLACVRTEVEPPEMRSPWPKEGRKEWLRMSGQFAERQVLVHLPPRYMAAHPGTNTSSSAVNPSRPAQRGAYPLIIFLHGAAGSPYQADEQTRFGKLADKENFIVAFPAGLGGDTGTLTWNSWTCCGFARKIGANDLGFIKDIIYTMKKKYRIDENKIFLAGFSNGAMLAARYAIEGQGGDIAGIAIVSGALTCNLPPLPAPLSVLIIHGEQDKVARFDSSPPYRSKGQFCRDEPVQNAINYFIENLQTGIKPYHSLKNGNVSIRTYKGRRDTELIVTTIAGAGHAWPGGIPQYYRYCDLPTNDLDATRLIWDHFRRWGK